MADVIRRKYSEHKASAKRRNIPFELTFEQWLEIWGDKIGQRGTGANQLGMLRHRDEGGYTVGNVRLGTPKENQQEKVVCYRVKKAQTPTKRDVFGTPASGAGAWLWRNNVFKEYTEDEEEFS